MPAILDQNYKYMQLTSSYTKIQQYIMRLMKYVHSITWVYGNWQKQSVNTIEKINGLVA